MQDLWTLTGELHDMDRTVLSLFSGYGGLDLGLHAAVPGTRVVGYCERDAYAAAILLARMEEQTLEPAPVFAGSIEDADFRPFQGVGWVTGGFPCQPFSTAGKRRGQDDERWLWDDIVRVLREVQPRWCLFENVPGLVRLGLGPVLRDLAVLGFDVEWDLFKASDVGASHQRERLFILAHNHADRRGEQRRHLGVEEVKGHSGRCSEIVADANGSGRWPQGDSVQCAAGLDRGVFAPGPSELDVWARVLSKAPQVEPSLCRMADGSARWLDTRKERLRAGGNGVVPLQAAVAIRVLAERAGWSLND